MPAEFQASVVVTAAQYRRRVYGGVAAGTLLAAAGLVPVGLWVLRRFRPLPWQMMLGSVALGLLLGVLLTWVTRRRLGQLEQRAPGVSVAVWRLERDRVERNRLGFALFYGVFLVLLCGFVIAMRHLHDHRHWVMAILQLVLFAAAPVAEMGGASFGPRRRRRIMNDEFTAALRGRACMIGYFLAAAGMGGLVVLSVFSPGATLDAAPVLLTATVAVPMLWFAVRERGAQPGD